MERWARIGVGAAVIALVGWIAWAEGEHKPRRRSESDADAGAGVASGGGAGAKGDAGAGTGTGTGTGTSETAGLDGGALAMPFLDASIGLPHSAPRTVHIGVVLVQFQGAEGASNNARAKKDALAFAEKLRDDARADFKRAVRDGDAGSSEDIGRIPRGVLDPRSEVAVFSLGAGEISEVLETPKGYWIVKRIE